MKKTRNHLLSFTTLIVFFFIAIASSDDAETEENIANVKPEYTVSAQELYKAYEDNGVAADEKYKDKVILVNGIVETIDKDITDAIYVTLKTSMYLASVQCLFADSHTKEAAGLKKGMKVSIKGKVDGKLGNVILRGCTIESIK